MTRDVPTFDRTRLATALLAATAIACGDDGAWKSHALPDDGSPLPFTLSAVWSFAPDDVWVGGSSILHWDGQAWTEVTTSPPRGAEDFWGFAPDDLWAASGDVVLHWDGARWNEVPFDPVSPSGYAVAIWGVAADDLWVGTDGNGEAIHWDGSAWSIHYTQTIQVEDLWGSASDDVWAVGLAGYSHWNGVAWNEDPGPIDSPSPSGLWGFARDDVWAADEFGYVAHFDGVSWTSAETEEDYAALWGTSPDDLWGVGDLGIVSHFDGEAWSTERLSPVEFMTGVHGSSASDVWIVGTNLRDGHGVVYQLR